MNTNNRRRKVSTAFSSNSSSSSVKFHNEVTIIHIRRKSDEEIEELFWNARDYQRMRKEDINEQQLLKRKKLFTLSESTLIYC
mmetsp:Transcript_3629/g.4206  ORF Transcript_3629/g.4206 Transcript_3629/m.4206 type:complete len:83 (-) Transcript_3629:239-487(-)